jgi:hypothetical protein
MESPYQKASRRLSGLRDCTQTLDSRSEASRTAGGKLQVKPLRLRGVHRYTYLWVQRKLSHGLPQRCEGKLGTQRSEMVQQLQSSHQRLWCRRIDVIEPNEILQSHDSQRTHPIERHRSAVRNLDSQLCKFQHGAPQIAPQNLGRGLGFQLLGEHMFRI